MDGDANPNPHPALPRHLLPQGEGNIKPLSCGRGVGERVRDL
jgi:hypothetical protein